MTSALLFVVLFVSALAGSQAAVETQACNPSCMPTLVCTDCLDGSFACMPNTFNGICCGCQGGTCWSCVQASQCNISDPFTCKNPPTPDSCTLSAVHGDTMLPPIVKSMNGTLEGVLLTVPFKGSFTYFKDNHQSALYFTAIAPPPGDARMRFWFTTLSDTQSSRITRATVQIEYPSGNKECYYVAHPLPKPIPFIAVCTDYTEMLFDPILQGPKRRFDIRCLNNMLPLSWPNQQSLYEASVFLHSKDSDYFPVGMTFSGAPADESFLSPLFTVFSASSTYQTLLPRLSIYDPIFQTPTNCQLWNVTG